MSTLDASKGIDERLLPYVPDLLLGWAPTGEDVRHLRVTGTLAFVDISGFTRLTERLARKGKVGAEEMSDILSATFAGLLTEARDDGADLVKWGGDAILLLFQGPDHALRAARAAHRMRATLRVIGRVPTTSGNVTLRMSVGVHSGDFDFFLVGDPEIHRELLISGPAASVTADTEAAAAADQIGAQRGDGRAARTPAPGCTAARRPAAAHGAGGGDAPPPSETTPTSPTRCRSSRRRSGATCSTATVDPEHRLITVAFVQFSGTDELLLTAGPGALADALDEVVRNVQHACADHDVTFFETDINRDGGKIMLTAGAPRSADHDEERMLRVARLVLDRAGRLPLRIGINRGHVFSGDFGPAVPADLLGQGRRHQPGRPGDGEGSPGAGPRDPGGRGPVADRVPHHRAAALPGQGQDASPCGRRRSAHSSASAATTGRRCRSSGEPRRWRSCARLSTARGPRTEASSRSSATPASASPGSSPSCWPVSTTSA